jgi:YD repeat-containing protein
LNGDGTLDQKRIETKKLNADGSRFSIQTDTDLITGKTKSVSTDTMRADGSLRTISKDLNGDGVFDQIETMETLITGQTKSTISNNDIARDTKYLPSGGVTWKNTIAYSVESGNSVDGNTRTSRYDYDGDGRFETKVISRSNIDGSVSSDVFETAANGSVVAKGSIFTTADGQTTILTRNLDNDGDIDERHISVTRDDGSISLRKDTLREDGTVSASVLDTVNSVGTLTFRTTLDDVGRKIQQFVPEFDGSSQTTTFDAASGSITSVSKASSLGVLVSATLYDPANSKEWVRVEQAYDAEGRKTTEKQFFDNGTSATIVFVAETSAPQRSDYFDASGMRTKSIEFDVLSNQPWREIHRSYDAQGNTLTLIDLQDAGSKFEYTYDVANTQGWSRYINQTDSAGRHIYAHQLNDDGTAYAMTLDPANAHPWSKVDQSFDAAGRMTLHLEYKDNGYRAEYTYDASNSQPWQRYANFLDDAGRHYYAHQLNDDGSSFGVDFDVHNSQSWWRHEQTWDAAGRRTSVTLVQDDGTRNTTIYDAAGNREWSRIEQNFNGGGQPTQQFQYNDDGSTDRTDFDVNNRYDWYATTAYGSRSYSRIRRIDYDNGSYKEFFGPSGAFVSLGWNYYDQHGNLIERVEPYNRRPVTLDLNEDDHLDLRPIDLSGSDADNNAPRFDWNSDGLGDVTAWVGPEDGFLAIDIGADGSTGPDDQINQAKELAFTLWPTEEQGSTDSDLEAVRLVFDTSKDGLLSAEDARWSEFRVWQDINQNGVSEAGELSTLDQLGIKYINLIPTPDGAREFMDGSAITGTSFLEKFDGKTQLVGDVRLAYRPSPAFA